MPIDRSSLLDLAREARLASHAPYTGALVGAALLTDVGISVGCRVENVSTALSCCAERVALYAAVADGATELQALALVGERGLSVCDACLEVLAEFALDLPIHLAEVPGGTRTTSLSALRRRSLMAWRRGAAPV